ncbi:MAG: nuclear transport factor 2 family protein [Hamadaea sp.]|nr:nuclear transport factor 2 family protein [Hamadaea sp.]
MTEVSVVETRNLETVRRYLRTFVTKDLGELRAVVAEDVRIYGAGQAVQGRHFVEGAVGSPGLTVVDQQILELHAAGDRVTAVVAHTYRHDRTGRTAVQSACKLYELRDGRIVRFWGESDLFGLLRGLDLMPEFDVDFS